MTDISKKMTLEHIPVANSQFHLHLFCHFLNFEIYEMMKEMKEKF